MVTCLLLTASLLAEPELGPLVAPGTTGHFQNSVQIVCKKLMAEDFDEASNLINRLPKKEPTFKINWEGVPEDRQTEFQKAIDDAVATLNENVREFTLRPANTGEDILISFVEELPVSPDTLLPQGLVTFQSINPQEPAIEGVIALTRMSTKVTTEPQLVGQEFAFVVGQYLGLSRTPGIGGLTKRSDSLARAIVAVGRTEIVLIQENFAVVQALQEAIANKTPLQPAKAVANIDRSELDIGEVAQGDIEQFQVGVFNRGNAPLLFSIVPDCSCFRISTSGRAEPGQSANISILMDTSAFIGPQLKNLYVYTNDPEHPLQVIPVRAMIRPAYRFIEDGPQDSVVYLEENGAKATVYLTVDDAQNIVPHSSSISGVSGTAVIEPWEGELPDPVMNEPPKLRKGFKITVLFAPGTVQGRVNATLSVLTNNEDFKVLSHNFRLQRGVAASPKSVYLGDIENAPTRAFTILSAPGRPFKIESVESRSEHITTEIEPLPSGEYKLNIIYDGKGLIGDFATSIKVHTDLKDMPVLEIPVIARLK